MRVILTHIGEEPPPYVRECLRQFRIFNPETPVTLIAARRYLEGDSSLRREFGVEPVWAEELESDPRLVALRRHPICAGEATPRTTYPSQPAFRQRTLERFFFIASLMERDGREHVFHFENDVLIYRNLQEVLAAIGRGGRRGMYATPVTAKTMSGGLLFVDRGATLAQWCDFVLAAIARDATEVMREWGVDRIDDMTLLRAFADRSGVLHDFPVLPGGAEADGPEKFDSIFDGASWGQFAGGTNNGHGPGWVGRRHLVGPEILRGNYRLGWERGALKTPFVLDRAGRKTRINNLHIHSKNLRPFTSWPAEVPASPRVHAYPGLMRHWLRKLWRRGLGTR